MRELRFHREVYREDAVGAVEETFADVAKLERASEGDYIVVRVTGDSPAAERALAGELSNFVLGVTIDRAQGAQAPDPALPGRDALETVDGPPGRASS